MKQRHAVWNQNVSHISLQIGRIFVFYSSKVSNLKKASKIRPKNDSFQTFEGLLS